MTRVLQFKRKTATLTLSIWDDNRATLADLYSRVRRQGHATMLLEQVTWFADRHNLTLTLMVEPYGGGELATSDQLRKLYEKFEFVTSDKNPMFMERRPLV